MAWTKDQEQAILSKKGNFLVSAGAGSGKTAVLSERVYYLVKGISTLGSNVCDPNLAVDLKNLLILTFTKDAAAEMKSRIKAKFAENNDFENAEKAENADITTFDAFARKIVLTYGYTLNLPTKLDIGDDKILESILKQIIDDVIEEQVTKKNPQLHFFIEAYCAKNADSLKGLLVSIIEEMERNSDPKGLLRELRDKSTFDFAKSFLNTYEKDLEDQIQDYKDLAKAYLNETDVETIEKYIAACIKIRVEGGTRPKKQCKSKDEEQIKIFKAIKEAVKKLLDDSPYASLEITQKLYNRLSPVLTYIFDLSERIYDLYQAKKKEVGLYSFGDIAYFANLLVKDPNVLAEVKKHYQYIMVDEYQDTSDLQESFLNTLTSGNMFMVGDVKQSIYAWRYAYPEPFLNKERMYEKDSSKGHVIRLKKNFRSADAVINDINKLFQDLMTEQLGEVSYRDKEELEWGNEQRIKDANKPGIQSIVYYTANKISENDKQMVEAKLIAQDILKRMKNENTDSNSPNLEKRPLDYGDFLILIRRKKYFNIYRKVFNDYQIPIEATEKTVIRDNLIFLTITNIINLINDDEKDVDTLKLHLAGVLRSYLYSYSDEKIYHLLKDTNDGFKKNEVFTTIRELTEKKDRLTPREMMDLILATLPIEEKLYRLNNVKENFAYIQKLLDTATTFSEMGRSFKDYVEHFAMLGGSEEKEDSVHVNTGINAVHLMTIHASKGLQNRIVYVPDLNTVGNANDKTTDFLVDKNMGVVPLKDFSQKGFFFADLIKKERLKKSLSEKMRLFYVALTRAQSEIIFIKKEDDKALSFISYAGKSYLIQPTEKVDKNTGKSSTKFYFVNPRTFDDFLKYGYDIPVYKRVNVDDNLLKDNNSFDRGSSEYGQMKELPPFTFKAFEYPSSKPLTKERASKSLITDINYEALKRGNKLHRYLELTDLKTKDCSFIKDDKDRKVIERVLQNHLFDNLEKAEIFKEYEFFDEENNLDGIIDLLIVKPDEIFVIDYKTRNIDDESYNMQVKAYGSYIERVFGMKPKLYLLSILENRDKLVM